jgi:hypothetical protein
MIRTFRYAPWTEIIAAFLAGWRWSGTLPGHHDRWSVLVEWPHDGDPLTGDCSATSYRERNGGYEFLTREGHWMPVPTDRITFLPIAGDPPSDNPHHAHLCYKTVSGPEVASDRLMTSDGQSIIFYCAHISPQSY